MPFSITVTLALIAGLAAAQDQGGRGRGRFPGANIGFTTLDANSDGVLDAKELDTAPASLARLDKNADGQITSDEIRLAIPEGLGRGAPAFGRGRGGMDGGRGEGGAATSLVEDMVKTLMAFDANGDGKLSKNELPERFRGVFDRGDDDKDGFLTPAEIRKVASAQTASAGSSGRGRPDGAGEGRRGEMNFIRIDPVLAAVDTDGDGLLSAEEIRNPPALIRKLDKNGDGQVTRDEALPSTEPGRRF